MPIGTSWNVLDEDAAILWREYRFSKTGIATSLAFRGTDGLVVVSPPCGLEDRDYDALAEHGKVRALVANNTFHNLGIQPWHTRFPDASVYAPARAIGALAKKTPGIAYRPLGELALPDGIVSDTLAGFKTGESFFSVPSRKGKGWFTGDLLANIQRLPKPPLRWLFSLTSSGPGFRLFKPAVWLMVSDKKALRASMLDRLAKDPPAILVPSHGPPAELPDLAAEARMQLERL